ncbi:MAG: sulfite exporter TauE/SafE family protein [Burkholderiales bacterium]
MSLIALIATSATLGALGGVHCVAMCSGLQKVAVHGLDRDPSRTRDGDGARARTIVPIASVSLPASTPGALRTAGQDLVFQLSRIVGYTLLGAAVGVSSEALRWGAAAAPLMRPIWGLFNAALLGLGLALLVLGRQPVWIDGLGRRIWSSTASGFSVNFAGTPSANQWPRRILSGLAWSLLPCGLLYSALAVAALASSALGGASVMLAFGAATALDLLAARWLLHAIGVMTGTRLADHAAIGVRIGGALLSLMAIAALFALALGQPHPFCNS